MTTLLESLSLGEVDLSLAASGGTSYSVRATTNTTLIGSPAVDGIPDRSRLGMITVWDLDARQWRAFKPAQVETWLPR